MQLGYRALNFSTNVMLEEIDPEAKNKPTPAWLQAIQVILPFAFFIFMYKFLPLFVAEKSPPRAWAST